MDAKADSKKGESNVTSQYTYDYAKSFTPSNWLPQPTSMMESPLEPTLAPNLASMIGSKTPKNPVMLVHEKYPEALKTLTWHEVKYSPTKKGFYCSATVKNNTFHAEAESKKLAKQLLAQNILKTMMPNWQEECADNGGKRGKRKAMDVSDDHADPVARKKAKILDQIGTKSPQAIFNELNDLSKTSDPGFVKPEFLETNISEPGAKPYELKFQCTIKMKGQEFTATSGIKKIARQDAVLKALKAIYNVDLTSVNDEKSIIMKLIDEQKHPKQALQNVLRCYCLRMCIPFSASVEEVQHETTGSEQVNPAGPVNYKEFKAVVKMGDKTYEYATPVSKRGSMDNCLFECLCKHFDLDRKLMKEKLDSKIEPQNAPTVKTTYNLVKTNALNDVSLKNKSPIQVLNEIAVRNNLKCEYEEVKEFVSEAEDQAFCFKVTVGDKEFRGFGKNRKLAKQDAGCQALKCLFQIEVTCETTGDKKQFNLHKLFNPDLDLNNKAEFICKLVVGARTKYAEILSDFNVIPSSTFSAFMLTDQEHPDQITVVSLASGSRCNPMRRPDGTNLHDCHGAVLARRGLLLYFYQQLEALSGKQPGDSEYNNSIFEEVPTDDPAMDVDNDQQRLFDFSPVDRPPSAGGAPKPVKTEPNRKIYRLKKRYAVHLYESGVPPGDASADPYDSLFKDALRTYQPDGIATVPLQYLMKQVTMRNFESFNADSRSMSLSDKLLKWNVLGVQGSLLSLYVEPIYIESIILAQTCQRQQLKKAIFGRFDATIFNVSDTNFHPKMPNVYFSTDVPLEMQRWAGAVTIATVANQGKASQKPRAASVFENFNSEDNLKSPTDYSLVWTISTPVIEFITQDSGLELYGRPSRLSKQSFFDHYCKLRRVLPVSDLKNVETRYNEAKQCSGSYVMAKNRFVNLLKANGLGVWLEKSMKLGDFTLPWLND